MKIKYKPSFLRLYKKLHPALKEEMKEKIDLFRSNPKHPSLKIHPLKGKMKGCFSFSVNYRTRVIFIYETKNTAALLFVGGHDIYQ